LHDYIIVGAGSAGCVLAARLTQDESADVLLIEAGGADAAPELAIPAQWLGLGGSPWDWNYSSEPEPGLGGRPMVMPRGRVLGGSSSINAMVYIRGNRLDYEEWAAVGGASWGYDAVLPYFKRSEDNGRGASRYHGVGGPLTVTDPTYRSPLAETFVDAAIASGLAYNDDFNGEQQEGVGVYQFTIRGGRRCSAATAFLRPALGRPNLTLLLNGHATRVVVEGDKAVGVEIVEGGQARIERAVREVILSAGAFGSPQLLMLSGIGAAAELSALGIGVVADLPGVGAELRDHISTYASWTTPDPVGEPAAMGPEAIAEFQASGTGPLSSNLLLPGGFVRTDAALQAPNIQFHVAALPFGGRDASGKRTLVPGFGVTLVPYVCKPVSTGRLTLASSDPFTPPRVLNGYYTSPDDIRAGIAGLRLALEIGASHAFDAFRLQPAYQPPATDVAALTEYLRETAGTVFHPVGTCAMGNVVDAELRVMGIDGLRVVDASVMPTIPRGNTNAPTIMLAEKAADLIRRQAATTTASEKPASAGTRGLVTS
jgi:choline dehydrogenase